jgi:hypothetical protein
MLILPQDPGYQDQARHESASTQTSSSGRHSFPLRNQLRQFVSVSLIYTECGSIHSHSTLSVSTLTICRFHRLALFLFHLGYGMV